MKLVTFSKNDKEGVGVVLGDGQTIADLKKIAGLTGNADLSVFDSMQHLIESGKKGLDFAYNVKEFAERMGPDSAIFPLSGIKLMAPIPRPIKLRCFSVYERHMIQALNSALNLKVGSWLSTFNRKTGLIRLPKSWYKTPAYYKGNHTSVSGPDDEIQYPAYGKWLDYEVELAVIIGKAGKNIPSSQAMDYVFGYTCFNDFSERNRLFQEIMTGKVGPVKGKDFDGGNSFGPCIVTKDEIPNPYDLKMEVRINGKLRNKTSTQGMTHKIDRMIEIASEEETIYPGEIFGTGAAADGAGIESLKFLKPKDIIEIEIEKIGILRNTILPKQLLSRPRLYIEEPIAINGNNSLRL